jgi:hypothetical protein
MPEIRSWKTVSSSVMSRIRAVGQCRTSRKNVGQRRRRRKQPPTAPTMALMQNRYEFRREVSSSWNVGYGENLVSALEPNSSKKR